jgi:undecaprenyl pyrophosphate synthase
MVGLTSIMDAELVKLFDIQKEAARELRELEIKIKIVGYKNRELMDEINNASKKVQKATVNVTAKLHLLNEGYTNG